MRIHEELDPMPEHRTQFVFKCKGEDRAKVDMPKMTYPNQHIGKGNITWLKRSCPCARYRQS